ncbi:MAG TPA: 2-phosphosulfolactate phosphatase [Candidatus Binataceae bacterium]|nr:2-phosphosulfolactate phosphatase [Candidatus Binataceae bacterium]
MTGIYDQSGFDAQFEWGPDGARELGRGARVMIVVDVMSFSTAIDVAVSHGATAYPCQFAGGAANELARRVGGIETVARLATTSQSPFSLSPPTMAHAQPGMKIIVASPNGAQVSLAAAQSGATVMAGCLRNASAVARAALAIGAPIAIIAAGERWSASDTLRPAFEDLVGAGAILAALGAISMSPEAHAALAAFRGAENELLPALADCASGRELIDRGFEQDVTWASERDVSTTAPILRYGAFVAMAASAQPH